MLHAKECVQPCWPAYDTEYSGFEKSARPGLELCEREEQSTSLGEAGDLLGGVPLAPVIYSN
jgi:hypothetical protein